MSGKNFFEIDPPAELDEKIQAAALSALAENRRAHLRRRFMQWLLVPAFSMAGLVLLFRYQGPDNKQWEIAEFADWQELNEDDFEMMMDLELVENLDELEEWKDV